MSAPDRFPLWGTGGTSSGASFVPAFLARMTKSSRISSSSVG